MRRIIINERDNTTSALDVVNSTTNIVYVPGFAGLGAKAEQGVPQLVTSLADFKYQFGDAPKFAVDQMYPEFIDGKQDGFPKKAIPGYFETSSESVSEPNAYDLTWFKAGDIDPSYVYAVGLLNEGLAVVYERMNATLDLGFKATQVWSVAEGNYVDYEGVVSSATLHSWEKARDDATYVTDAAQRQSMIAALAEYEKRVNGDETIGYKGYDVSVTDAYNYMYDRAFNGHIETTYNDDGTVERYGSAILNKNEYDAKYLTSGGYPAFEHIRKDGSQLASCMIETAEVKPDTGETTVARGDCVALIDHTDNPHRPLEGAQSVYKSANFPNSSYAAMFTPWCSCSNGYIMPASFVYLSTFATAIRSNPSWMSIAGVSRGIARCVESLHTDKLLTNRLAEEYQAGTGGITNSLNAITYIKNYGYTIWGNRTTIKVPSGKQGFATSFLNTRCLVSDVKKEVYAKSKALMFEVNNDLLWINFEGSIAPLLDSMVSGYGLKTYSIIKRVSSDKTKLSAEIVVYPTYCVESVSVNIVLQDEDVLVTEG